MKYVLKNIFIFSIINFLLIITTNGQSAHSSSVSISIKLIKKSDAYVINQNSSPNEMILNAASNELSRDLVLNFSKKSSGKIENHEQISIIRENEAENIKVDVNKSICLRNVEMNEIIKLIPSESLSKKDINRITSLTIAY